MAQTPYSDLSSQDILSAHISGLQHDIIKIQQVLDMKTDTISHHALVPVADQDDPSLRYRIYEGTVRNWLNSPAPIIRRNGEVVSANEYAVSPAHGVVVFNQQQNANVEITADFIHVIGESDRIETLEEEVSSLEEDINELQTNVSQLESDVDELKNNSGSHSGFAVNGQQFPLNPARQLWVSVLPGKTVSDLVASDNILMVANTIDAMPIFIETRTTINKMRVDISSNSTSATMHMAIYSDANAKPHELLATTGSFTTNVGTQNIIDLQTPVTLDVGVYWICRFQSAGIRIDGHKLDDKVHITIQNASPVNSSGTTVVTGVRTEGGAVDMSSGMPEVFPPVDGTNARYLARLDLGTVYALK
ncbi:hypothetical protein P4475_13385 [Halalkalibacterium halodurans]|uniref:hypothetical protein n=1 Tax=Halalkalibacterium halodurans TaxID=86665 RepID=UPI002E229FB3|nr:hypothetical protein [Halalkalibacterium halodurans]